MGSAVLAHGNARMGGADLHIQMGIADGIAHLLIGTSGREHGKGAGEGNLSHSSETRRNSHHVAFRNTAVDVAVGKYLLERIRLRSICQVRIQNHQVRILCAEFRKGFSVGFSGRHFLNRLRYF